ncbi:MAG: 4-alpha-glucanotransferase [Chloroflexi bacterium]|nr:4-alpha-glucanotransferase [Chloroflexota bacterium]
MRYVRVVLPIDGLPPGYHTLHLEMGSRQGESFIISAPRQVFAVPSRTWGLFAPLYALRSTRDWGIGDFTDLDALARWVGNLGHGAVGTLPLTAAFLDEPYEYSPYMPVSRRFWNEIYLDVDQLANSVRPEPIASPERSRKEGRAARSGALPGLRKQPLVDYKAVMAAKRQVLEPLARQFFATGASQRDDYRRFVAGQPHLDGYARFRAAVEQSRKPWPDWPSRQRSGHLTRGDYDEAVAGYHRFVQFAAHRQLGEVAAAARKSGPGLYLDLPVGVHPSGYDIWQEPDAFATGLSTGAPPDALFFGGQNWAFPPLHPDGIRRTRYRYFIDSVRRLLSVAGILRVDHVMGFHRIYVVPPGLGAKEGTYVRYNAAEFYAILSLESHRSRSWIVGENLGTVPAYTDRALATHGIGGQYVVQYRLDARAPDGLAPVPPGWQAGTNTHDMPPWAGFWQGVDITDRQNMGLITREQARIASKQRSQATSSLAKRLRKVGALRGQATPMATHNAVVERLAAGKAALVMASLEDLWGETLPQNTPGTSRERPNWRRKVRYPIEQFTQMRDVIEPLEALAASRRKAQAP